MRGCLAGFKLLESVDDGNNSSDDDNCGDNAQKDHPPPSTSGTVDSESGLKSKFGIGSFCAVALGRGLLAGIRCINLLDDLRARFLHLARGFDGGEFFAVSFVFEFDPSSWFKLELDLSAALEASRNRNVRLFRIVEK